jgi:dUTP pyrophosphatase
MSKRPASPIAPTKPAKMPATAPPASAGLLIKRLSPTAQLPTRGSSLAAGYDLYASASSVVPAGGKALVSTGLSIAVPEGTYGRVAPRSGLASKWGIHTGAGVVDADYRGEVFVLLFNLGEKDLEGEFARLFGCGLAM